jgi:hypothetical protein
MSVSGIKSSPREGAVSFAESRIEAESPALERCYSPEQIAELWSLSPDTVRRIFGNEPGVLAIERPRIYGKRHYRTLRIPESVAQRVYHRLALKGGRPTC